MSDELQKGKELMPLLNCIISNFLISFQALSQCTSCMVLTSTWKFQKQSYCNRCTRLTVLEASCKPKRGHQTPAGRLFTCQYQEMKKKLQLCMKNKAGHPVSLQNKRWAETVGMGFLLTSISFYIGISVHILFIQLKFLYYTLWSEVLVVDDTHRLRNRGGKQHLFL